MIAFARKAVKQKRAEEGSRKMDRKAESQSWNSRAGTVNNVKRGNAKQDCLGNGMISAE